MRENRLRDKLIYPAVVGAMYAVLTMILAPLSYGGIQFRAAEILCICPFFLPDTALGLCLGCAAANTLSAAGVLDILFGSLATYAAGLCTAGFGRSFRETGVLPPFRIRLFACLMPVLWNGIVVGAVLSLTFTRSAFWQGFLLMGGEVACSEFIILCFIALPLFPAVLRILKKLGIL